MGRLRRELGLDSGLASCLLRGLEAEGLLRTEPDRRDARRRRLSMTASGRREFEAYEALSDQQARELLVASGEPEALLSAMDRVTEALQKDPVVIALADVGGPDATACLERYYEELSRRFEGGFAVERSSDPAARDISPPRGAFFVAAMHRRPVGCVALRRTGPAHAEIKRLWVSPDVRGRGVARRLMAAAEAKAIDLGVASLRLDTNRALPEALALYQADGWIEVPRFNDDPYADRFFEKTLRLDGT